MIRSYSKRLLPPYSGQVQIVESEKTRALTLDGKNWEIQFLNSNSTDEGREQKRPIRKSYIPVAMIRASDIQRFSLPSFLDIGSVDERILELSEFLTTLSLPFPALDHFEYWLLDAREGTPLALIYSCTRQDDIPASPSHAEWTALPASMMAIELTADEKRDHMPPVNYRLERLVCERAGQRPRAAWFNRICEEKSVSFPPYLVTEQWEEEDQHRLCQRYIARQAPRLLMLHGLGNDDRSRLELAARKHALEVERFYPLYPTIVDNKLMAAIRVEARLRKAVANNTLQTERR
ncbi:MAG: hypothetical protein LJE91_17365 [Gammaproteobacteria bacterium]|jgi:hypothetical protein|nr:hypothetical protein [Gammaproteobacteria bacterium]